jgi:uncharacterized protein (DUF983 family)
MVTFEVERPDGPERGVRIACPEHGERREFPPGRSRVTFYCPDCEFEVEVALHDALDGRPWSERC